MIDFQARFEAALSYGAFLDNYGTPEHQQRWADLYERFKLSEAHREVLDTFVREMNVLCMAGAWCGDCAIQCPIFEHFARACSRISPPLINIPFLAPIPVPTRMANGVANPKAHGQATTNTATNRTMLSAGECDLRENNNALTANMKIKGTKKPTRRSARAWTGALRAWASSTDRMIWDNTVLSDR